MRQLASQAVIRMVIINGKGLMDVTVISELSDVAKVRSYYVKATELAQSVKGDRKREVKANLVEDAGKDVPNCFNILFAIVNCRIDWYCNRVLINPVFIILDK